MAMFFPAGTTASASVDETKFRDSDTSDQNSLPSPAKVDSSSEDTGIDDEPDGTGIVALGRDCYYHRVHSIKDSYLKKDPRIKKRRPVKRSRWCDADSKADAVQCPDLPFRSCVNSPRKGVVDLKFKQVPLKKKAIRHKKNLSIRCQFCPEVFSSAQTCREHERLRCQAPGSLNHICDSSCDPGTCPGRKTLKQYVPQDRRHNNPSRLSRGQ